jgi:hypothetical protein
MPEPAIEDYLRREWGVRPCPDHPLGGFMDTTDRRYDITDNPEEYRRLLQDAFHNRSLRDYSVIFVKKESVIKYHENDHKIKSSPLD